MTVARMREEMDCVELYRWQCHFEQKHRKQKAAMAKSKSRRVR